MNTHIFRLAIICIALAVTGAGHAAETSEPAPVSGVNQLTNYPRIEYFEQGSVQVDFPTIDSWADFQLLEAWLPVEVILNGEGQPHVGSALVRASTDIDFEQRTVNISDLKVMTTKFSETRVPDRVIQLVSKAFQGRESIVPLDIILRLLPEDFEIPKQGVTVSQLNFEPPVIMVSEEPVRLLSIDKEPVKYPVSGTELEWVVNTNWNVFYDRPEQKWYVLNGETWQSNNYLSSGGWVNVDQLPSDFEKLAQDDYWKELHSSIPPRKPDQSPAGFVVSLQATELILLDGSPRMAEIEGTDIQYVTNTDSDLLRFDGNWYFLVSGRWFKSSELDGRWTSVRDLPGAFSKIPSDHKKGHVLFSVPGTRQARLALIEAAIPHRVSVPRNAGADLQVTWVGEPRFEPIDTTGLERGVNTPFQVIKHNNYYYLCYEGAWFFSDTPHGEWKLALEIPDEIYRIPATDPAFNVTFVSLATEQNDDRPYVNYQFSGGYRGSFSTRLSVVYGTGWSYPSEVFWDSSNGSAYWNRWQTYGYNIGYNPVGAYYGGRGGYYNRWYGGWGAYNYRGGYRKLSTVTIESPSVNYDHGYGSAWEGPLQTTPGDPAKSSGDSLDRFLPKKKVDGTETFTKITAEDAEKALKVSAASLYASTSLSSSRFSTRDGEVYKKEDQEWQQYKEGDWNTMNTMQQHQSNAARPVKKTETAQAEQWLPAHKRTLSRSELDEQELARLEGMDNYAKYRMEKQFEK